MAKVLVVPLLASFVPGVSGSFVESSDFISRTGVPALVGNGMLAVVDIGYHDGY